MDPMDVYQKYERAWNELDNLDSLLADAWAENGVYADDEVPEGVVGRQALADLIRATHRDLPGFRVWRTCEPRMLAGRLAVTWSSDGGDPPAPASGTDVIEFDADGRIARVTDVLTLD